MRKIYKLLSFAVVAFSAALSTQSCVKDFEEGENQTEQSATLTVEQAKQFFEEFMSSETTRAYMSQEAPATRRGTYPGNFTPKWDKAKVSAYDCINSVDVPIIADYSYTANWITYVKTRKHYYRIPISQKLIVVKNDKYDQMTAYVMSILPDNDCYMKYGKEASNTFKNAGSNSNFSGIVTYARVENNMIMKVDQYKKGQLVRSASVFGDNSLHANVSAMKDILQYLKITGTRKIATRNWGEEKDDQSGGGSSGSGGGGGYSWPNSGQNTGYNYDWSQNWGNPNTTLPNYSTPTYSNSSYVNVSMSSTYGTHLCVPASLSYLSNCFGDRYSTSAYESVINKSVNSAFERDGINQTYNIATDGYPSVGVPGLVDAYFKTEPFISFDYAINNGHLVMTDVVEVANNGNTKADTHNVVVVGKTNYNYYIFKDPADGQTKSAPADCFGVTYAVPVSGKK